MIAGRHDTVAAWRPVLDGLRDEFGIAARVADSRVRADALFAVTAPDSPTAWVGCRGWHDDAGRTGRDAADWARVGAADAATRVRRHLSPGARERDRLLDALHAAGYTRARRILDWTPTPDGLHVEWSGDGAVNRVGILPPEVDGLLRAWCDRLDAYANA